MKHAIVIFTKIPKAGETKTRLTEARGGILTPEEARDFYRASLLDVIDSCIAAAVCDIYVCHDRDGDLALLEEMLAEVSDRSAIKKLFPDNGETFDKGMQYAADCVLGGSGMERLADSVMIVGGDMPSLQPGIIRSAVRKMERLALAGGNGTVGPAMVVSADQECGFNIIGYTFTTPFDFDGVFYNRDGVTALDMVSHKVQTAGIPLAVVEAAPDVDVPVDLAGFISVLKTMRLAARYDADILLPERTMYVLEELGLEASAPVPEGFALPVQ